MPLPGLDPGNVTSESESEAAGFRRKGDEWALWDLTGRDRTGDNNTVGETLSAGVDWKVEIKKQSIFQNLKVKVKLPDLTVESLSLWRSFKSRRSIFDKYLQ